MKYILSAIFMAFLMLGSSAYADDKVNVNTASAEQLQEVKGIGVKTADAIVLYRVSHGEFKSLEDLTQVKGIGDKKLAKIEAELEVGDQKKD